LRAGTVLGEQCIVGANAVVKGSFPNHCVLAGNPAKIIKQFNEENGLWEKVN
jgi:acetyltransferase-like isoleucine patch superfamily enzyme